MNEYLALRQTYFPYENFRYIFTLYEHDSASNLTEQKLNIALKHLSKEAGIKQNVTAHLFRHSLATHLLADGRTIVDVKEKLRHSNISVTSIYVHSDPVVVKQKTKSLGMDLLTITNSAKGQENETVYMLHQFVLYLLNIQNVV